MSDVASKKLFYLAWIWTEEHLWPVFAQRYAGQKGLQRSMPVELARGELAPARVKGLQRSMPVECAPGGLARARDPKGLYSDRLRQARHLP